MVQNNFEILHEERGQNIMLIKITDVCKMECIHCCENSLPTGTYMAWETFTQSIQKAKSLSVHAILISGGEPTEHPYFIDYMKYLINFFRGEMVKIVVLSNGMFLSNEKLAGEALELDCEYQITNDERYYPKKINIIEHPKLVYEFEIRHVCSMGRAKDNNIEHGKRSGMKCFNLRTVSRQKGSLKEAIQFLEFSGKGFCVPSVNVNGDIKPGEFSSCKSVGNVWTLNNILYDNIKSMPLDACDICGDRKYLGKGIAEAFTKLGK